MSQATLNPGQSDRVDPTSGSDAESASGSAPQRRRLSGKLGVASIVFIVVAAASPLGVIGGPVPLGIAFGNGTGFPLAYIVVTAILLLFAVGFTTATPHVPEAGAFYSYVDRGLGRSAGLGAAFAALLSYVTLEIAVYGLLGPGVGALLESYGVPAVPWWVWAAIAFVVVAFLGHRNITLSSRVLGVLLIAEVLIVVVFDAVVVFGGNTPEGLSPDIVNPAAFLQGAPGVGLLFAILSFIGFEATAVFRDEAKNPNKTIPRATYISLILIGVFYAISSWALISAFGASTVVETASQTYGTLLSDATATYLGVVGAHIIQVLFVTSLFACILSFHNIVSRYFFSLASKGVLPTRLGDPHDKHRSPHRASLVDSAIVAVVLAVAVLFGLDPIAELYTWFAGIASVGIVLLLALTSIAVIVFFRRNRGLNGSVWKTVVAPILGLVGLLSALVLIIGNIDTLTGSQPVSITVLVLLVLAFAAGPVVGRLRRGIKLS